MHVELGGRWFSGWKICMKIQFLHMQRCLFIGSDMSGLLLKNIMLIAVIFQVQTSAVITFKIPTSNNLFKDCSLIETEFSESYIYGCDFTARFYRSGVKTGGLKKNTIANAIWTVLFYWYTDCRYSFAGTLEDCYLKLCIYQGDIPECKRLRTLSSRVRVWSGFGYWMQGG